MKKINCLRCKHEWYQRTPAKPVRCPKCGSPYWDRPRQINKKPQQPAVRQQQAVAAAPR
jgi:hypothetical protein